MSFIDTLMQRNADFTGNGFTPGLKMLPTQKTTIIGCVDPRCNPATVFKLQAGEAAVIRTIGGRVTPAALETMALLRTVAQMAGTDVGAGWNLIVMHHTNCGIAGCYQQAPELLARHLGVTVQGLEALAITDPHRAVAVDVAALKANPKLPAALTVTGMVYEVEAGKVHTVVPPAPLRPDEA